MYKKKSPHILAIIGNGFDIAHGYNTRYQDFIEKTSHPALTQFRSYCDNDSDIKTWFAFEENINILTQKLFLQSFDDSFDYDETRSKAAHLKEIFSTVQRLLAEYLKSEIKNKPTKKLKSVNKYLNSRTKAINFNYTNTAEKYAKDIFYVHGSLKEDDILLGYDYRDEACLAQYDDMCWSKNLCREGLAFRRYLKKYKGLAPESNEFKKLSNSFETYQECENSSRGIDDEAEEYIPNFQLSNSFMKGFRKSMGLPSWNWQKISTIAVMGHGIEADKVFLEEILSKCTSLKRVIIFTYNGESAEDFNKKSDFFKPHCKKIEAVLYGDVKKVQTVKNKSV